MAPIRAKNETVAIEQVGNTLTDRGQAIMDASLTVRLPQVRPPHCCKHWLDKHV
ncbi:MAG TPA: hypothetical protein VHK27_13665 [Gammaproteobacteria bacterium]|nr:hypothetical protein [Gammaproteobacteria bacterium]